MASIETLTHRQSITPLFGPRAVIADGDSITYLDQNLIAFPNTRSNTWVDWAERLSGGQVYAKANPALPGRQSSHILAAFDGDTQYLTKPAWLSTLIGTNDARSNVTLGQFSNNYQQFLDKVRARGFWPVVCTIPPSGVPALGAPPAAPTLVVVPTGGTLGPGTYVYGVTSRRPTSTETTVSATASVTIASGSTNSVYVIAPVVRGAAGFGFYRTTGTAGTGSLGLLSRFAGSGYSNPSTQLYIDTGSVTPGIVPPATDGTAIAGVFPQNVSSINTWLRAYARANDLPLVDWHALLADPLTGFYLADYSRDGIHPSPDGSIAMARLWLSVMSPYLPPAISVAAESQLNDAMNIAANPLMVSSVGTNWVISNADNIPGVTQTAVTKTGFKGNAQQLHVPYTGAAAGGVAVQSVGLANALGNFQSGDTLEWAMLLEADNIAGARIQVIVEDSTAFSFKTHALTVGGQSSIGPILLTDRFVSNGNNLIIRVQVDLGGCDVYFGQVAIRNLSRMQGVAIP